MNDKCNENLYVKPVEVCNFKALKMLNTKRADIKYKKDYNTIFKTELKTNIDELNYEFRDTSDNKFKYNENVKDKKFLCYPTDITKKEYYLNCVLETGNPLFTFKDGVCMVHPDLNLNKERLIKGDDGFVYINNAKDEQGNFKYFKKRNTAYCEDKWFDWIITPNYHFGNRYYRDSGAYSKEDVKKCYKPCGIGRLPYLNDNNEYICVSKEVVYDGIYKNKLDYSPIALINLIGNNKENLKKLYKNLFIYKTYELTEKNENTSKYYERLFITDGSFYPLDNDKVDNYINEAYEEIKKILNTIVTDNNLNIPSYSTEKNHLTYKHPNFNENDETLLTYIGLDKNEVISNDIILIHTAFLANEYYNKLIQFIDITKFKGNLTLFNIKYNLNDIYDIKNRDKQTRLANILYKAINICYDNKTDFSKNIIYRTTEAFNRYNIFKTKSTLFDIYNKTDKNLNIDINIEDIKNGFEIKYYNKNDYNNLKNNLKNELTKLPNSDKNNIEKVIIEFDNNFIFFTEETSELLKGNNCQSGSFPRNNRCVKCNDNCINTETCSNDSDCQIYCKKECDEFKAIEANKDSRCGRRVNPEEDKIKMNENIDNVKTPIDDENYIPNFSYIFKTSIKIFFALIVVFVAYIFYKLFGETILTLVNMIYYPFMVILRKIWFNNDIKYTENNYDIIKKKYDEISRSLIQSNALKDR